VAEDRLRFDITHPRQITREELDSIEREVNRLIWENSEVSTTLMTPKEAMDAGAMALFGEKYGEEVRVLSMGAQNYSVELCGGTHVTRTGDIGLFKIISESKDLIAPDPFPAFAFPGWECDWTQGGLTKGPIPKIGL
jgi:alanyl-tRNA synthetase